MNIFITGGGGFIGRHLVDRLLGDGHSVTVYDSAFPHTIRKRHGDHKNLRLVWGDLMHIDAAYLRNHDAVVHLAAYSRVDVNESNVHTLYFSNVEGMIALLHEVVAANVKKIIFASSSTVYGNPDMWPTGEHAPVNPVSHYGASKLAGEALLMGYCSTYGLDGTILRLANIVGPHCHGVVPDLVNKLKVRPEGLEIMGDGSQTKSYLHVSDLVDCIKLVLNTSQKGVSIFNVGTADAISVLDIAREVFLAFDRNTMPPIITSIPNRKGDVTRMIMHVSKIQSSLGWRPALNSREAVRAAIRENL